MKRRTVIDMNESVDGTRAIMVGLLKVRGITGCFCFCLLLHPSMCEAYCR